MDRGTIEALPGGANQPLNQVLLQTPGVVQDSFGDIHPERAHRFDVGVSHRITPAWTVGADAYCKNVRDLLDFGQFGGALIFTPINYRKGHVYGVEFSSTYRADPVLLYGNLALVPAALVADPRVILPPRRAWLAVPGARCGGLEIAAAITREGLSAADPRREAARGRFGGLSRAF